VKPLNKERLEKYNIYDFASKLFRKYGKNIGCLHFDHVAFFVEYNPFLNGILNLNENSRSVKYENYGRYISYIINKENQNLLSKFQTLIPIVKCLNETFMKKSRFNYKFNNVYASKISIRDGKSIFDTNLVQAVNQHWADSLSPGSIRYNVPFTVAFVSHIRDELENFVNHQSYPFEFLRFDFEYYLFLLSIANQNKLL
jgi:hypothetical protein